uniref:DDE_Tnp_1_7 domain-containing protein n=1 Tax=Heterorhabditis bacteriophora TaxID=37862 RepID=A0A1I7WEY5_HETBA
MLCEISCILFLFSDDQGSLSDEGEELMSDPDSEEDVSSDDDQPVHRVRAYMLTLIINKWLHRFRMAFNYFLCYIIPNVNQLIDELKNWQVPVNSQVRYFLHIMKILHYNYYH